MIVLATLVALFAVGAGFRAVAAHRGPSHGRGGACLRLFLQCLQWGVATGAATGALTGVLGACVAVLGNGASLLGVIPFALLYGTIIGALVSVIPSVVGGLLVTGLIQRRHPHPSSEEAVRRDLIAIFRGVVVVLDAALLVGLIAASDSLPSVAISIPFVVAANACVVLMLCRARESIGQTWLAAAP